MMLRRFTLSLLFIFSLFSSHQVMAACTNWTELSGVVGVPGERIRASMAFDPCSGNLVLFGGVIGGGVVSNETYVFNGTTWSLVNTATSPSARQGATMVFDPCSGRMILFGGSGALAFSELQDTWAFDGTDWTQITTVTSPAARRNAMMTFDPCAGKIVLYGGFAGASTFYQDTWTFDGTDWTDLGIVPGSSPPPLRGASMEFDPCIGRTVLFGGQNNLGVFLNETWTFDGATLTWAQLSPTTSPPARHNASMAFDPCKGNLVLFGGIDAGVTPFDDTWEFNGTDWVQVITDDSPPERSSASMEFFPCLGQIILYGGSGGSVFTDTWSLGVPIDGAGSKWDSLPSIPASNERSLAAMAFDPCIGKIVLFGGEDFPGGTLGDTWTFDGTTWTELMPATSPSARRDASMAFDPCLGKMILFGGITPSLVNDTWEFDGTTWTQLFPTSSPLGRSSPSMAFDPCLGQMVLFGGFRFSLLDDTWVFNGTTWTQLSPTTSPPPRRAGAMAFNPCTGLLTLFGGVGNSGSLSDTWVFNGTTWTQLSPSLSPTARHSATMEFDPCTGRLILFGGRDGATYFDETWAFDGTTWTQLDPDAPIPTARDQASMAFNPCIGQMVLFGGVASGATYLGDAFGLTAIPKPIFLSDDNTTFTVGSPGTFTVEVCDDEVVTIANSGLLPTGVSFVDNGDGTATLSGTPTVSGVFNLVFTASNGISEDATQNFTLTVTGPPSFTSANSDTFTLEISNSFTVTTTGFPTVSSIILSGDALPTGVMFVDNGNGTATLSGTPAAGTGGTYNLVFTASNGVAPDAVQNFTLEVNRAPVITSADSINFPANIFSSFTVTTTGFPDPAISDGGATLPLGVNFADNGDGTATLSGTPASGTGGNYPIIFTASNGVAPDAVQNFTLTVVEGPLITSAASTTFSAGGLNSFTVTTVGVPTPSITQSGALPSGVTFVDNGDGTGTLSGSPETCSGGIYNLVFTASNGMLPNAVQNFTLTVNESSSFISPSTVSFVVGGSNSFLITTCGFPVPTISSSGTLATGITFTDNGDGTATLSGTPPESAEGDYPLVFTASNGLLPNGTQNFLLRIIDLLPPSNLQGVQIKNVFPTQTEFVNVLTWQPPQQQAGSITSYRIYRDSTLQKLVASVRSNQPLRYEDHNRAQGVAYTYYIVSVDSGGSVSDPVSITIGG